ncbi:hypothetical protein V6615_16505 (plasmid) [Oscillospiraceae bacterium PP1C4]
MADLQEDQARGIVTIGMKVADIATPVVYDAVKGLLKQLNEEHKSTAQELKNSINSFRKTTINDLNRTAGTRAAGSSGPPVYNQQPIVEPLKMFDPYAKKHGFSCSATTLDNKTKLLLFRAKDRDTLRRGLSDFANNYRANLKKPSLTTKLSRTPKLPTPSLGKTLSIGKSIGKVINLGKIR